jgi:hypothetical protein
MATTIETFARRYFLFVLTGAGGVLRTSASTIEPDKRKTAKAVRAMLAEGYVENSTKHADEYIITRLAYNQIIAEKPTLPANTKAYDFGERPGVEFSDSLDAGLSMPGKKYIIEHADEYTCFTWDTFRKEVIGEAFSPRDQMLVRETIFGERSTSRALLVTDAAYTQAVETFKFEKKLSYVRERNLAWGLGKLKLVADVDADVFATSDGKEFFGRHDPAFGHDPSKWGAEADVILKACRGQIAEATRKASAVIAMQGRMQEFGGWDKFLAEYERLCVEAVTKEGA